MEKDESKHNNKIKQIINIKEIIKTKNRIFITNDAKKSFLAFVQLKKIVFK